MWSASLRGSRGVTDAPRRTRAAAPCGDERPPCRHGGSRLQLLAAWGRRLVYLVAFALARICELCSQSSRVARACLSFWCSERRPDKRVEDPLRWGTGVTAADGVACCRTHPPQGGGRSLPFCWKSVHSQKEPPCRYSDRRAAHRRLTACGYHSGKIEVVGIGDAISGAGVAVGAGVGVASSAA